MPIAISLGVSGAHAIYPGGPGGSGTNFLQRAGDEIATIVNTPTSPFIESDGKYFDIISWDPRGVNNTTPRLNCFPDAASSDTFKFQAEANGIDSSSSAAVSNLWARSKALAAGCSEDNEILKHMNTAPVVADMVEIIERHGEWRAKQAQSWLDRYVKSCLLVRKILEEPSSRNIFLEPPQNPAKCVFRVRPFKFR